MMTSKRLLSGSRLDVSHREREAVSHAILKAQESINAAIKALAAWKTTRRAAWDAADTAMTTGAAFPEKLFNLAEAAGKAAEEAVAISEVAIKKMALALNDLTDR